MAKSKRKSHDAHMRRLISRYESGDLGQAAFCRRHRLALSTFGYWLRKCRSEQPLPAEVSDFIPLRVSGLGDAAGLGPELHFADGTRLLFGPGTDPAFIRAFIPQFQN